MMRKIKTLTVFCLFALFVFGVWSEITFGHVFPERAEPQVGAVVDVSPTSVRIWFDGVLEPIFSTIRVQDKEGRQVDNGDSKVDVSNPNLIEVSIPSLLSGTYRVIWSVIARDGHRTEGDYTFTIK